jgi:hypothetical protein
MSWYVTAKSAGLLFVSSVRISEVAWRTEYGYESLGDDGLARVFQADRKRFRNVGIRPTERRRSLTKFRNGDYEFALIQEVTQRAILVFFGFPRLSHQK